MFSAPYCHEKTRRIACKNRTVVESSRTMLHSTENFPKFLWAEAVVTAVHTLTRTTNSGNKQ